MSRNAVHYKNAPVVEAIIDFRVEWPVAAPDDAFLRLSSQHAQAFPVAQKIHALQMTAKVEPHVDEAQFSQADQIVGIRLDTSAEAGSKRVVQFQKAGFTYSHLPPYTEWDAFRAEAQPLWESYRATVGVETVTRTAVRFINRFRAPASIADLGAYIRMSPAAPAALPGVTRQYVMQVVRELSVAPNSMAAIMCGASEVEKGVTEFLLDFDVFINAPTKADSPVLWDCVARLRDVKNQLFEEVITDQTRALF